MHGFVPPEFWRLDRKTLRAFGGRHYSEQEQVHEVHIYMCVGRGQLRASLKNWMLCLETHFLSQSNEVHLPILSCSPMIMEGTPIAGEPQLSLAFSCLGLKVLPP